MGQITSNNLPPFPLSLPLSPFSVIIWRCIYRFVCSSYAFTSYITFNFFQGDYVEMDDVVVVIETDKVSVDVRAPSSGVLVDCFGEPDDVVEVFDQTENTYTQQQKKTFFFDHSLSQCICRLVNH